MIIIVTFKKNTLIVSSELTVLHKHDLISPLNGAGTVNSVFQKKDMEVHCSPVPWTRPHIKRRREDGIRPRPFPFGSQDSLHWSKLTCLVSPLTSLMATELVPGFQGDQSSQSHQHQIPQEKKSLLFRGSAKSRLQAQQSKLSLVWPQFY